MASQQGASPAVPARPIALLGVLAVWILTPASGPASQQGLGSLLLETLLPWRRGPSGPGWMEVSLSAHRHSAWRQGRRGDAEPSPWVTCPFPREEAQRDISNMPTALVRHHTAAPKHIHASTTAQGVAPSIIH